MISWAENYKLNLTSQHPPHQLNVLRSKSTEPDRITQKAHPILYLIMCKWRTTPGPNRYAKADQTAGFFGGLGDAVDKTVSGVGNTVGSTVSGLGKTVGGATEGLGKTVGGASEGLGNTAKGVGQSTGSALGSVGGKKEDKPTGSKN